MASVRDGRYNGTSMNLESFTCEVCGKRRHTGRYSVSHKTCSKIKQQWYEERRVEDMAAQLHAAIERKREGAKR